MDYSYLTGLKDSSTRLALVASFAHMQPERISCIDDDRQEETVIANTE